MKYIILYAVCSEEPMPARANCGILEYDVVLL